MSLFRMRKPRDFHHGYIYYDERKEKLRELEDKARRELGMEADDTFRPELLRGAFVRATHHLRRRKENERSGRKHLSLGKLLFLIIALAALWVMLAK